MGRRTVSLPIHLRDKVAVVAHAYDRSQFEHLGKVFLSHATPDKPFVHRLARQLEKFGVEVWLDERELIVGDSLPSEISDALHNARAVIIVISESSIRSDWMRHELRVTTQRMISGQCRLIPVLRSDVVLPSEMTGLLYSDCRPGRRGGTTKIAPALAIESGRLGSMMATMESNDPLVRIRGLHQAIDDVFGGRGWGTTTFSATKNIDFSVINGSTSFGREVDVVYETLLDYGYGHEDVTLYDWHDWKNEVNDELGEHFGLLISERLPSTDLQRTLDQVEQRVWKERLPASTQKAGGAMLLVYVGLPISDDEARSRLTIAHDVLVHETTLQVPPLPSSLQEAIVRTKAARPNYEY